MSIFVFPFGAVNKPVTKHVLIYTMVTTLSVGGGTAKSFHAVRSWGTFDLGYVIFSRTTRRAQHQLRRRWLRVPRQVKGGGIGGSGQRRRFSFVPRRRRPVSMEGGFSFKMGGCGHEAHPKRGQHVRPHATRRAACRELFSRSGNHPKAVN